MVKGISRQVIVVPSPDPALFEQAIFILKDHAVAEGISQEKLLQQANALIRDSRGNPSRHFRIRGPLWALFGAMATGVVWLITVLI